MRDRTTGLYILDRCETSEDYYSSNEDYAVQKLEMIESLPKMFSINDDLRRFNSMKDLFLNPNSEHLDFGCGQGNLLKYIKRSGGESKGVELNENNQNENYNNLMVKNRLTDTIILTFRK